MAQRGQSARGLPWRLTARSLYLAVACQLRQAQHVVLIRRGRAIRCYAGYESPCQIVSGDERPLRRIKQG